MSITQFEEDRGRILANGSYGAWVGLAGVLLLAAGALITALQARRRVSAVAYPPVAYPQAEPYPPVGYPPAASPYRPTTDPPAKRL